MSDSEVDPRVKNELDSLNEATDAINHLETQLSSERKKFNDLHTEAKERLAILMANKQKAIAKTRPYYEAIKEAKQANDSLQLSVTNYHRANGVYRAAKETISLAEQSLRSLGVGDGVVDAAWQETLNINTKRFIDAEIEKKKSETLHAQATKRREILSRKANLIKKKHKKLMEKSKRYFLEKECFEELLQTQRSKVEKLQQKIETAKKQYKDSLKNLENISLEIHQRRLLEAKIVQMAEICDQQEAKDECDDEAYSLNISASKKYGIKDLENDLKNFDFDDVDDASEESSNDFSDDESEYRSSTSSGDGLAKKLRSSIKSQSSLNYKTTEEDLKETRDVFEKDTNDVAVSSLHGIQLNSDVDKDYDIFDELC